MLDAPAHWNSQPVLHYALNIPIQFVVLAVFLQPERLALAAALHEDTATLLLVLHQHLRERLQLSVVPIVATWPNQIDSKHQAYILERAKDS